MYQVKVIETLSVYRTRLDPLGRSTYLCTAMKLDELMDPNKILSNNIYYILIESGINQLF